VVSGAKVTISEAAADWHKLSIQQRIMRPSIVHTSEQLGQRCSQQTSHTSNQPATLWPVAYLGGGPRCDAPPLARPWKFFTGDFIWKDAFLPFSSKNCKIQLCL